MKNCENCNKQHDGSFATGRFCCRGCVNGYARGKLSIERKTEINKRVSEKLSKYSTKDKTRICPTCHKVFIAKQIGNKSCSRSCSSKLNFQNLSSEQKGMHAKLSSDRMKQRYAEGDTSIGWQTRTTSSYPEKFFEQVLTELGVTFKREVRIGKWFADFVIGDLVLEIDGRQHDDRKEQDAEKDAFLKSKGYRVSRIRWRNPKTKTGLQTMMSELNTSLAQW